EGIPPKREWKAGASAIQEDIYPAQEACDGKMETRWSSPAQDPQWLLFDLGREATICGLTLHWETAFSSEYLIDLSRDGNEWTTVYSNRHGDGRTDYVSFTPQPARFVRITGLKRATGCGHSIREVDIHGVSEQLRGTSGGQRPECLFDGRTNDCWTSSEAGSVSLQLDLGRDLEFGGLRIDWGTSFARDLEVLASDDGMAWRKITLLEDGTGAFDVLLFPKERARFLRLMMKAADEERPIEIREITLRGPDEVATPLALYQLAAEKTAAGFYPDWLRHRQVYWTVLGLPDDTREALFDEYGNLEPQKGGCSVMPYIYSSGKLQSALSSDGVVHSLADGFLPIPSVAWEGEGFTLRTEACAAGQPHTASAYVRYVISNTQERTWSGRLYLAIRPLQINPPWQYGGLASSDSMQLLSTNNKFIVVVNGESFLASLTAHDGFGVREFDRGDIVRELAQNRLPELQEATVTEGLISGALAYDISLMPGEVREIWIAAPLHKTLPTSWAASFEEAVEPMQAAWSNLLGPVQFELPNRDITDFMKAQMIHLLIHRDGKALQPGSRQYERSWIRDGAMMSVALLRMGLHEPVREFIEWYEPFIQTNGMVPPSFRYDDRPEYGPGSGLEYDGQGAWVYLVMTYYRHTGDLDFLKKHYPSIQQALAYLVELRERSLNGNEADALNHRFVGILPESYSHEGYDPPMHSYWDDFWALLGWKEGIEAANLCGHDADAQWAEEQYHALRTSLVHSIQTTMQCKNINTIPGCAEKGDFDPTSSCIALIPCDERTLVDEEVWQATFDRYLREVSARLDPGWCSSFTPYEARNISALVEIGRKDEAVALLNHLLDYRQPRAWQQVAEVALGDPRLACYIGDLPHAWAGSGFVNAIREMVLYERAETLELLRGTPLPWLEEGRGIRLRKLPTHFGPLNLSAQYSNGQLMVNLDLERSPKHLLLRWPLPTAPRRLWVDEKEWMDFDADGALLPGSTRRIQAEW
ncbi:MAG: discoidin domain-containing protein, partial [Kiritimatiellae bacterium]|nr:discoidin domain-containing protein [Kiritimatiellia bacterium]